jgi:hypothetical protein
MNGKYFDHLEKDIYFCKPNFEELNKNIIR